MDQKFLDSLSQISTADAKSSAESVFQIFSAISNLDESGVMAAYHTYRFYFEECVPQDEVTRKRIRLVRDAIINRMEHHCSLVPEERRPVLAAAFISTIRDPIISSRLRRLMQTA